MDLDTRTTCGGKVFVWVVGDTDKDVYAFNKRCLVALDYKTQNKNVSIKSI